MGAKVSISHLFAQGVFSLVCILPRAQIGCACGGSIIFC
jgi:hypothetical protein